MSVAPYSDTQTTYVELVVLRRLDRAILRQALDDADGFVELGRHDDGGIGASR